ncbi:MAG: cation transporter [Clostridia bacterium]|nr:cation transporter [Clostridia bacterium]
MFTKALIGRFVRDSENTAAPAVRTAYGKLAGMAGLAANIVLFLLKLLAGIFSGSVAIIADAFNNLSDAGSSVVTLVGFRLAGSPPDEEHPFGHGRVEYLSALTVAALIMLAGVELAGSAIDKILEPASSAFSWTTVGILMIAILVKLWMARLNRYIGGRIRSDTLIAAATDSRNDVICTTVVLVSSIFTHLTSIQIDGYVGVLVSLFVIWSGFSVLKETLSPLLGEAPDPELVEQIRQIVLENEGVVGIHDLIVHNYGPGRCIVSLHAEVPAHGDILHSHELIDAVERRLVRELNITACIHMDPVDTQDEQVRELRVLTETILGDIDPALSLHDFRLVRGEQRMNVIFDVVVPFGYAKADLQAEIERRLQNVDKRLFVVLTVEHSFT